MSLTQPTSRGIAYSPVEDPGERSWYRPAGLAVLGSALGAMAGSTLTTALDSGTEWATVLTPLTALAAATAVYTLYRSRRLDRGRARLARALVLAAGVLMAAALGTAEPRLAVVALWSMSGITVVVTALAGGAGARYTSGEPIHPPTSWTASR